jgi:hypothetical protein
VGLAPRRRVLDRGFVSTRSGACGTAFQGFRSAREADATFIAAANPTVVLTLLAELEKSTIENACLREDRDSLLEAGADLL